MVSESQSAHKILFQSLMETLGGKWGCSEGMNWGKDSVAPPQFSSFLPVPRGNFGRGVGLEQSEVG